MSNIIKSIYHTVDILYILSREYDVATLKKNKMPTKSYEKQNKTKTPKQTDDEFDITNLVLGHCHRGALSRESSP